MKLNIPINEAVDIIKTKTHKPIGLRVVSSDTINVGYEVNVKIPFVGVKSKTISIDFVIDKVIDTDLYFHYSTGIMGGDTVINALFSFIPTVNDSNIVEKLKDGSMILHLCEIKQIGNVLDKIQIDSISFDKDSILFEFTPKI